MQCEGGFPRANLYDTNLPAAMKAFWLDVSDASQTLNANQTQVSQV